MKAMTYRRYGGPEVVTLSDVEKPSPKPAPSGNRKLATLAKPSAPRSKWPPLPCAKR